MDVENDPRWCSRAPGRALYCERCNSLWTDLFFPAVSQNNAWKTMNKQAENRVGICRHGDFRKMTCPYQCSQELSSAKSSRARVSKSDTVDTARPIRQDSSLAVACRSFQFLCFVFMMRSVSPTRTLSDGVR